VGCPSGPATSRLEGDELLGALADRLNDQRDAAGVGMGIGDGQRDAFGILREVNDDELPRRADFRNARGMNVQSCDVRA